MEITKQQAWPEGKPKGELEDTEAVFQVHGFYSTPRQGSKKGT